MTDPTTTSVDAPEGVLRAHAEDAYADELAALAKADDRPRPPRWRLSPWAVSTYVLGGELGDGTVITPKYFGQRRLVETAIATLATDRALLLRAVEANLDDRSFWLRKGIGWGLRDYARTDPEWVWAVVDRLGDRLSPLSRREATKHRGTVRLP